MPRPGRIGVILAGQFYVYAADKRSIEKVNEAFDSKYKAGVKVLDPRLL